MKGTNIVLLAAILTALIIVYGCAQQTSQSIPSEQQKPNVAQENGRVLFTIADKAASLGAVSSVQVSVDKIMVHSAAKGWVDVSSSAKNFDLLKLKAESQQELLADVKLEEGTYDQIRLDISNVVVADAQGEHEAKLPSGMLKINGNIVVENGSTSTAKFDFVADQSLHITGNGKYIMAPVVRLETRKNADADIKSDNKVEVKGGKITADVEIGMDEQGNVGEGIKIPADAEISIDAGVIKIGAKSQTKIEIREPTKGAAVFAISDNAADMGSVTSIKVTIDGLMVHSDTEGWVNITAKSKTFDLLELKSKGTQELMANAELEPGFYNEIRLNISNVVVTDAQGEHEAKLPSSKLEIIGAFVVNANSVSSAEFDFVADESLHVTGDGKFIMAPVVKLETKESVTAEVHDNDEIEIKGGSIKGSTKVGMDSEGNVGIGRGIPSNADISIDSGKIKVKSKIMIG